MTQEQSGIQRTSQPKILAIKLSYAANCYPEEEEGVLHESSCAVSTIHNSLDMYGPEHKEKADTSEMPFV